MFTFYDSTVFLKDKLKQRVYSKLKLKECINYRISFLQSFFKTCIYVCRIIKDESTYNGSSFQASINKLSNR